MSKKFVLFLLMLSVITLRADVLIINGLTHIFAASSGQVLSGRIELQNNASEPAIVRFYLTDYFFHHTGSTEYPEAGSLQRSNANWIELQAPEVTVPGNSNMTYSFSVIVPSDENLSGTYWGVIMVEPMIAFADEELEGITVRTKTRYAVQVVTNFGEPESRSIEIVGRSLSNNDGVYSLIMDIKNTSDWWMRPEVSASIFNQAGEVVGEFMGNTLRLYPQTSGRFVVPFEGLSPGDYRVLALIRDGEDVWGAQYSMKIE
ncbi:MULTISPECIES: hypothetical protein [unclassified Mesotoga]|jgi:hypothetical protein|uniref:hypothetical protein n=1 Tax=unclassified Mesotoga TaxID=1184398 RepID=UPI000B196502|nr:hypothetical protein [Mesotoga sp. B105.6.4]PNS37464.1 hypothetical protein RJ60_11180 [Mesotoga sp. B105.6.4]